MAGFVDYLRMMMGWWSSPHAAVSPYIVAKDAMFLPGALDGEVFTPGSQADHVFLAGALAGEVLPVGGDWK